MHLLLPLNSKGGVHPINFTFFHENSPMLHSCLLQNSVGLASHMGQCMRTLNRQVAFLQCSYASFVKAIGNLYNMHILFWTYCTGIFIGFWQTTSGARQIWFQIKPHIWQSRQVTITQNHLRRMKYFRHVGTRNLL